MNVLENIEDHQSIKIFEYERNINHKILIYISNKFIKNSIRN